MTCDYRKYHNLEKYLFEEVSSKYFKDGFLNTFDFFCIIIWKANRSKSKVTKRLLAKNHKDMSEAIKILTQSIYQANDNQQKLRILILDWGFRLPIASALLTVLYPKDFTVYDTRVCEMIGDFKNIQNKSKFESIWEGYQKYIKAVKRSVGLNISLRDKDRFLWGKSFHDQLIKDIENNFKIDKK
jgi:hypothetical protein